MGMAYRFIGNNSVEITQNNFDTYKDDRVGTPKMLLFTEKKGTPIVYRALSTYFAKTLDFGIVRKNDAFLIKKFKITKFPAFVLLKNKEKPLPFLNKDSGNDICLIKDGTLCVMCVVPNASASDEGVMAALQEVKTGFVAATESRIRFSFMRLDASAEPAMIKSLNLVGAAPKFVVMNAGKRKRFLHHDGDMNAKDL